MKKRIYNFLKTLTSDWHQVCSPLNSLNSSIFDLNSHNLNQISPPRNSDVWWKWFERIQLADHKWQKYSNVQIYKLLLSWSVSVLKCQKYRMYSSVQNIFDPVPKFAALNDGSQLFVTFTILLPPRHCHLCIVSFFYGGAQWFWWKLVSNSTPGTLYICMACIFMNLYVNMFDHIEEVVLCWILSWRP